MYKEITILITFLAIITIPFETNEPYMEKTYETILTKEVIGTRPLELQQIYWYVDRSLSWTSQTVTIKNIDSEEGMVTVEFSFDGRQRKLSAYLKPGESHTFIDSTGKDAKNTEYKIIPGEVNITIVNATKIEKTSLAIKKVKESLLQRWLK